MDIQLIFNNSYGDITSNSSLIESYSFSFDIQSIYAHGEVVLKEFGYESMNEFKTGTSATLYIKEDNRIKSTIGFKVLSFNKVPTKGDNFVNGIKINLVSSYYFAKTLRSRGYQGTFSTIVRNVINNNSSLYKNYSLSLGNIVTTDDKKKVRYQIYENDIDFLMRNLKYAHKGELPVYLYLNPYDGKLTLSSISSSLKATPKYTMAPDTAINKGDVPSKYSSNLLSIYEYSVGTDTRTTSSKTTTKLAIELFVPAEERPKDSDGKDTDIVTLYNNEGGNPQSADNTPYKVNYFSWTTAPDDAQAIATRKNFEDNMYTYYVVGLLPYFQYSGMSLGNSIRLILPRSTSLNNTNEGLNLGEGIYLIKGIEYIYTGQLYTTKLTLIQLDWEI